MNLYSVTKQIGSFLLVISGTGCGRRKRCGINETIDLINMFTTNGEFARQKDKENFRKLFSGVIDKLKTYTRGRGIGYGKFAGMEMIRKLALIKGTEQEIERIREVICI